MVPRKGYIDSKSSDTCGLMVLSTFEFVDVCLEKDILKKTLSCSNL